MHSFTSLAADVVIWPGSGSTSIAAYPVLSDLYLYLYLSVQIWLYVQFFYPASSTNEAIQVRRTLSLVTAKTRYRGYVYEGFAR